MGVAPQELSPEDLLLGNRERPDAATPELLICSIYEDQRPLKGVAGRLDWRLRGFLSKFVMQGRIQGKHKEFVYIPIKHQGRIRHLMVVGLGAAAADAGDADLLEDLAKTVGNLHFQSVALSRSSFGFATEAAIKKHFKGIEVEFIE